MPAGPRYERVPLQEEEENTTTINKYFSGTPSTAPPSFSTIPLHPHSTNRPHRYDENAATVMPPNQRATPVLQAEQNEELGMDDAPVSLWGYSESTDTRTRDAESSRDDILLRLLEGVERLEARLEEKENQTKEEPDVEALIRHRQQQWTKNDICGVVGAVGLLILFLVFFAAIIIVPAVAKARYAGAMAAVAMATATPRPTVSWT